MNYGSEIWLNSSSILHPPSMCLIPSLLCIEVESFSISPSPSFLFSPPPDVSDSSSGTTLKLNQLHTHTHLPTTVSMSSLGLMPAFLPESLSVQCCPHLSHCDPVALLALAFNLAVIQMHPSLHRQTHTHTQMDFLSWQFETNQTVVWERGQMRAKGHQGTPQHNRVQALDTHTHTHLRTNLQDAHHCYRHIWGKITCCIHLQWHIFYNLDNISFTLLSFFVCIYEERLHSVMFPVISCFIL